MMRNEDLSQDPDFALNMYHRGGYSPEVDEYFYDYLSDQAQMSDVVFDIETTELIDTAATPISQMKVSVATALVMQRTSESELAAGAEKYSEKSLLFFWGDPSTERGAPLKFLVHLLDHAARIIAYNGYTFDLVVLAGDDKERLERWRNKLFDPLRILRLSYNKFFKLNAMLEENGLDTKTATGVEAVDMWKKWQQSRDAHQMMLLEKYNERDTLALAELVLLRYVKVPGHSQRTTKLSLLAIKENAQFPPVFAPDAPQSLVQGSAEWHEYRKRKIGGSTAAAFLRLDFRTTRDDAFERLIDLDSQPIQETAAMARGKEQEEEICQRYANRFRATLATTGSWPHPEHGNWLFASPDRLCKHKDSTQLSLVEAKSVTRLDPFVPDGHLIQVQLQLACAPEAAFVDYAQWNGQRLNVHRVTKDVKLLTFVIKHLLPVISAAWLVFSGEKEDEDVFVDDLGTFNRPEQQALKELLLDCRNFHVKGFD